MPKKKSFAVIGLGEFGHSVAEELTNLGMDVIAIDSDSENVERIATILDTAFVASFTDEKGLKELGIDEVDTAIVAFGGNIEQTIVTTIILSEFKIKHIIVRVDDDHYIPILRKVGATEVVSPQRSAGIDLANRLGHDDYKDYYKLDSKYSVVSIEVNPGFVPMPIRNLDTKNKYGVSLVLIIRNGKSFVPGGNDTLLPDDIIYIVGSSKDVRDFGEYLNGKHHKKQSEEE